MNNSFIISYDLKDPGQKYEILLKRIKSYPTWARLGGSAYIVISDKKTTEIRNHLMEVLDNNDRLYVGVVKPPAAWYGLGDEISQWLQNNLK